MTVVEINPQILIKILLSNHVLLSMFFSHSSETGVVRLHRINGKNDPLVIEISKRVRTKPSNVNK